MDLIQSQLYTWAELTKTWLKNKNLITSISVDRFIPTGSKVKVYSRHTQLYNEKRDGYTISIKITYTFNQIKNRYQAKGAFDSVMNHM